MSTTPVLTPDQLTAEVVEKKEARRGMPFFVRRILLSFVTLLIIIAIVTLIPNIAPGDPARKIAGGTASPERLAQVTESLGLNDSIPEQLRNTFVSVFTLDFGEAFTKPGESVVGLIRTSLWNSLKLVSFALVVLVPLSVTAGAVAAYKKDTWTTEPSSMAVSHSHLCRSLSPVSSCLRSSQCHSTSLRSVAPHHE